MRGRPEGVDWESVCCEYGPGLEMRSLNARREFVVRDGVLLSRSGDEVLSRLRGDLRGILDSEALDRLERVKVGFGVVRACGLGVVRLSGLKLWPMIVSLVLTLEFHLGRPSGLAFIEGRGRRFPVGVAELCLGEGDARPVGAAIIDIRVVRPFRGTLPEPTEGILELRARPGCGRLLLLLDRSLPFFRGVAGSNSRLIPVITTDDAGELPGVSLRLESDTDVSQVC